MKKLVIPAATLVAAFPGGGIRDREESPVGQGELQV